MVDLITQINLSAIKDFIPPPQKNWQRTSWISLSKMKPKSYNLFLKKYCDFISSTGLKGWSYNKDKI